MSSVPDHWYLYFWDAEWGPAFLKICGYAPYPLWVCANGHEWAKRKCQLAKAGVGFEALDNGLRSVEKPAVARSICARLGSGHVRDLLRRMMAVMPDPLTLDDRRAGFDWRFSVAQLEVSDTAVFDAPRRARAWFEAAIGDHLDLGRPERVSLVVDRRVINQRAPGLRFGEPPTMALLASVAAFGHVIGGLTNKTLRQHMAVHWNPDYSQGQASYDLRRLRLKGFIERVAHTNTYRVTAHGRRMATFFTKLATRVVIPALTELAAPLRPPKATPIPRR